MNLFVNQFHFWSSHEIFHIWHCSLNFEIKFKTTNQKMFSLQIILELPLQMVMTSESQECCAVDVPNLLSTHGFRVKTILLVYWRVVQWLFLTFSLNLVQKYILTPIDFSQAFCWRLWEIKNLTLISKISHFRSNFTPKFGLLVLFYLEKKEKPHKVFEEKICTSNFSESKGGKILLLWVLVDIYQMF